MQGSTPLAIANGFAAMIGKECALIGFAPAYPIEKEEQAPHKARKEVNNQRGYGKDDLHQTSDDHTSHTCSL